MDIQSKVTARRLEREQEQHVAEQKSADLAAKKNLEIQRQKLEALDVIAEAMSTEGLPIKRDGNELAFSKADLPPLDIDGMKRAEVEKILKREARNNWTPGENWQAIGFIASGIALLYIPLLGIPLIGFGLWRRSVINDRHRIKLIEKYPGLFDQFST